LEVVSLQEGVGATGGRPVVPVSPLVVEVVAVVLVVAVVPVTLVVVVVDVLVPPPPPQLTITAKAKHNHAANQAPLMAFITRYYALLRLLSHPPMKDRRRPRQVCQAFPTKIR
jgi:hypothetical protein